MPSPTHEGIVLLFRQHPALAVELLQRALAIPATVDATRASLASEAAPRVDPSTLAADAVVLLGGPPPEGAIVVEVQLRRDESKRLSWPFYVVSYHRSLRCPVHLLIITVDESVASWAARPIEVGHSGFVLRPHVLGPSSVPAITDPGEAAAHPELAVLSALAHARDELAVPTAIAALQAVVPLDDDTRGTYTDLVLARLGDAAKAVLEDLMRQGRYEYQSEFARENFNKGKAEGIAEGIATGKAEGVIAVLTARGIAVSDEARERIRGCRDIAMLDAWLARGATVGAVEELLATPGKG